jgi:hypothetical protein
MRDGQVVKQVARPGPEEVREGLEAIGNTQANTSGGPA